MIKLTNDMRAILASQQIDKVHCPMATASADGWPQIGPKASVFVYDDETLAYWERSRRSALGNLRANPKVAIYYRNPERRDRLPGGAAWRFQGIATVYEDGPVRDEVMAQTPKTELDRDPERAASPF